MLKGKRAYICSPLSAKTREERMFNMGLAKAYLDTVSQVFHCRTYASHAYLPLMLDDTIPEERKLALSIGKQLLDFCDVLIQLRKIKNWKEIEYAVQIPENHISE